MVFGRALTVGLLVIGCAQPKPAKELAGSKQTGEEQPELMLGFLKPGESVAIPPQPSWREQDCEYPETWEGPAPGGVALYMAATRAEIRAAYSTYWPGEKRGEGRKSAEEMRAAFEAGARLAQVHVEAIEGTEVIYVPRVDGEEQESALEVVLEGPEGNRVWRLEARVVEKLAKIRDPRLFGERWARELTTAHKDPPAVTDERKKEILEYLKRLGVDTKGRTVENFHDDYVGHSYLPGLWISVACDLAQLARFAELTGREVYLTQYID